MLFSFSMTAKLMVAGVMYPLYALRRSEPLQLPPEGGAFARPVLRPGPDIVEIASSLRGRVDRYKFSARAHEFRTPACQRRQGEVRGTLRDIWEDTRLEAMQRLLEHGSTRIDALVSPGTQPVLLGALKQLNATLQQHPHVSSCEPLLDTVTAPFCAIEYLREKCLEVGASNEISTNTLQSFMNRCDFVSLWYENLELYRLTFAGCNLPTMFSIAWDEITRLAKDIAIMAVFDAPLETAIQRDLQRLKTRYAEHPRLQECCEQLGFQQAQISEATEPDDLTN